MCDDDDDKKKKERPFLSQRYCRRPFLSEPISRNFYFLLNWNAYVHAPFPLLSNRVRFFPFLFPFWWIEIKKKTYSINWIFMVHFLIIEMGTRKKKKEWNSFAFVWIILVCLRHFLTLWLSRRDFQIFSLVCRLMRNLLRKDSASGLVPNLIYQKKKIWDELCLLLKRKKN